MGPRPTIELTPGSLFGGYRIESFAGRGGMGVVYRATQLALGRRVALKLIAPDVAHEPRFRERFKRESRLAAAIDHHNVIPIYEAGEADGALFISMRWVEGPDLLTLIKRGAGVEPYEAARIVAQTGAALDAAHEHGLIHRDVKPGNVLVVPGRAGHAYLTDFGLVKRTKMSTKVTDSGEFVGTLDYVAPEQIEGKPDARSDVYSLGCVLFHSLTGRVPFERDTEIAKIAAHLHEDPPSPSAVSPGLPRQFDEIVTRAMAKDCASRYETAGEMGEAAVAVADGISRPRRRTSTRGAATARLPRDDERRRSLLRRPPRWTAALAVLVAAAAGAGVLVLAGAFGRSEKASYRSLTAEGTLLKARGDPGIYVVKSGAKFLISPDELSTFFAGEAHKIHLVSGDFLDSIPDVPREGSRLREDGISVVWVIHHGYRTPVRFGHEAPADIVPRHSLIHVPLPPTGRSISLSATAPRRVKEDQLFRISAVARSGAGVPKGICVFFEIQPGALVERGKFEAANGRCSMVVSVANERRARFSVHFFGYLGWRFPTAPTGVISVEPG